MHTIQRGNHHAPLMNEPIEISGAVLECIHPDVLEVRFKEGMAISNEVIDELQQARLEHFAQRPHHLLLIVPEDFDFHVRVMNRDHCAEVGHARITTSVAWVTTTPLARSLVDLYYAYYPSAKEVRMFDRAEDARDRLLREVPLPSDN